MISMPGNFENCFGSEGRFLGYSSGQSNILPEGTRVRLQLGDGSTFEVY